MTKKHFIALADYIRDATKYCSEFSPGQIEHLANFCHAQAPATFNRARWIAYVTGNAGPNGGAVDVPGYRLKKMGDTWHIRNRAGQIVEGGFFVRAAAEESLALWNAKQA